MLTAPILLGVDPLVTFDETAVKAAFLNVDLSVFVIDDDANFNGGSLNVTYVTGGGAEDNLTLIGGVGLIGTVTSDGSGGTPLTVQLNVLASPGLTESLIEKLGYKNTAAGAAAASRTVSIVLSDGTASPPNPGKSVQIRVAPAQQDFGDAPAPYPTLTADNGARHVAVGPWMGALRDTEADGQPNADALGDDSAGEDDEDGVQLLTPLAPGNWATIRVTVSQADVYPALWIDYDQSGTWDNDERVYYQPYSLQAGANDLTFQVPEDALLGDTFARIRVSTESISGPTGELSDGEVEDYRWTIVAQESLDFGDASSYVTSAYENGARHVATGPTLGTLRDAESDAKSDDGDDGVVFHMPVTDYDTLPRMVRGEDLKFTVTTPAGGKLDAWIDLNGDYDWDDAGEQIIANEPMPNGTKDFSFAGLTFVEHISSSWMRFRLSNAGGLAPQGYAENGEVEDYRLYVSTASYLEYGDAPDPGYPTLRASNGARHFASGPMLGAYRDGESDGRQSATALGDDFDLSGYGEGPSQPADDEEGVVFDTPLILGQQATLTVTATTQGGSAGLLSAWVDFNADKDWDDAGEHVLTDQALAAGLNVVHFTVPATATLGSTFARFRLSTDAAPGPTGFAKDGEVEDYQVTILAAEMDFGDAPAPAYPTLLASGGACHVATGLTLGAVRDSETDGQPDANALGDDNHGVPDDEDGLTFGTLVPGQSASVTVKASAAGKLDAWMDFDAAGGWIAGEKIFDSVAVSAGDNPLTFNVPAGAHVGDTFARFRLSTAGGLLPTGLAGNGEVEDSLVTIAPWDFGDAPDTTVGANYHYPTLLADNGARHVATGPMLGTTRDAEPEGKPSANANLDTDDGVVPNTWFIQGQPARLTVTASQAAALNAWADVNKDGDWSDAGEQIFDDVSLSAGDNALQTAVPKEASGDYFTRFRLSTATGLSPAGLANDGEVEDYKYTVDTFEPHSGSWGFASGGSYAGVANGGVAVCTVSHAPPLKSSITIDVTASAAPANGSRWSNFFVVFDYKSPSDFKFAGAFVRLGQWVIGHMSGASPSDYIIDTSVSGAIASNTEYALQVGIAGSTATLQVAGNTLTHNYGVSLQNNKIGLANLQADTSFKNLVVDPPVASTASTETAQSAKGLAAASSDSGKGTAAPTNGNTTGNPSNVSASTGQLSVQEDFNDGAAGNLSPQTGKWSVSGKRYLAERQTEQQNVISTLEISDPLPAKLDFRATFNADPKTSTRWSNAFLVFDYKSPTDFKFAGAFVGIQTWAIGRMTPHGYELDQSLSRQPLEPGKDYHLQLLLDGNSATLVVDGATKLTHKFAESFQDGKLGLATLRGVARFDDLSVTEL